jgi:outer membrane protein assembly factor BamB
MLQPVVAGDAVYVTAPGGHVLALDAGNGTRRWTFDDADGLSAVAAGKKLIYAASPKALSAIETGTGRLAWQTALSDPPVGRPAVLGDQVFVAGSEGKVVAFAADLGKELWQTDVGHGITTGPTAAGEAVYVGTSAGLGAVDVGTHQVKWDSAVPGSAAAGPVMIRPGLFIGPGGNLVQRGASGAGGGAGPAVEGDLVVHRVLDKLCAFEAGTGAARWTFAPQAPEAPAAEGADAGGGVPRGFQAVPGQPGVVIFNGAVIYTGRGAGDGGPAALAEGMALMGTGDGLFAADTRRGLQLWCFPTPDPAGAPVAAGGVIYFTSGALALPGRFNVNPGGAMNANPKPESFLYALPVKPAGK